MPARAARASAVRNAERASQVRGSVPSAAKRAARSGALGGDSGESRVSTSRLPPREVAPTVACQAAASRPRRRAVRSGSRWMRTAERPSSGWAAGTGGCAHSTASFSRSSSRNAGEASARGSTVAQTSWWNPGSVSSSVRSPPPNRSAASTSRTRRPASARVTAATSPLGPEPTTTASKPSPGSRGLPGVETVCPAHVASPTGISPRTVVPALRPDSTNSRPPIAPRWSVMFTKPCPSPVLGGETKAVVGHREAQHSRCPR